MPVALGRFEAVGRDLQRIVMPIEDAEQLTVPHVCEPKTLIVSREDPVALGGDDEVEGVLETVVGVCERTLGNVERERGPNVA